MIHNNESDKNKNKTYSYILQFLDKLDQFLLQITKLLFFIKI